MSQSFKFIYDDMKENDPSQKDTSSQHTTKVHDEFYSQESHARNICFVWLDGRRIFMNYSYLASGEYSPDQNMIKLSFTTQAFVLTGVNLEVLFYDLMHHAAKQVTCMDKRYNLIGEGEKPIVNEIAIEKLS